MSELKILVKIYKLLCTNYYDLDKILIKTTNNTEKHYNIVILKIVKR